MIGVTSLHGVASLTVEYENCGHRHYLIGASDDGADVVATLYGCCPACREANVARGRWPTGLPMPRRRRPTDRPA